MPLLTMTTYTATSQGGNTTGCAWISPANMVVQDDAYASNNFVDGTSRTDAIRAVAPSWSGGPPPVGSTLIKIRLNLYGYFGGGANI